MQKIRIQILILVCFLPIVGIFWTLLGENSGKGVSQTSESCSQPPPSSHLHDGQSQDSAGYDRKEPPASLPASADPAASLTIPPPDASDAEKQIFRKRLLRENLPPIHAHASRNFPATPAFLINADGFPAPMHAALDEVYLPDDYHAHEILTIPPMDNLEHWKKAAQAISPRAELILYSPDLPREEQHARMLGNTLILLAPSLAEAEAFANQQNWQILENLGTTSGRLLVSVTDPVAALDALRNPPATPANVS